MQRYSLLTITYGLIDATHWTMKSLLISNGEELESSETSGSKGTMYGQDKALDLLNKTCEEHCLKLASSSISYINQLGLYSFFLEADAQA